MLKAARFRLKSAKKQEKRPPIDFKAELNKLISLESPTPSGELTELLNSSHELFLALASMTNESQATKPPLYNELMEILDANRKLLSMLDKKQGDISLQVEEIYDIIGNSEVSTEILNNALCDTKDILRDEKQNNKRLSEAAIGLCDIIEDFYVYASGSGDETLAHQSLMMWRNTVGLLGKCGIFRTTEVGEAGQPLDPEIHSVHAAETSAYPKEHISRVLHSGYRCNSNIMRKAAVIVSTGTFGDATCS